MEKIVSLCKRRGFIFQSSEIYGGINGFWDYGPLGAELKRNLREAWWNAMTRDREDVVGLDASIIMHPAIWKASGHVDTFADQMLDCKTCKGRFRADHIAAIPCPQKPSKTVANCAGEKTEPRAFNLMFKSHYGPIESDENLAYLRPETAQAIFVQFKNVFDSSRVKIPFGIGQIGKAFRNEITPRNYTFRSREFEQMELEFFIPPNEAIRLRHGSVARWSESADLSAPQPNWGWEMWHRYWVAQRTESYHRIGLSADVLDYHWQKKEELAHYAQATVDILFKFPFGTEELEGIAARGDFDLTQHQKHSGKSLEIFDDELRGAAAKLSDEQKRNFISEVQEDWNDRNKSREEAKIFCEKLLRGVYLPHVIEPSAGLDRLTLAIICAGYREEEKTDVNGKVEQRIVMRFHPRIAPIKVGIFPLLKNKPELVAKAREVFNSLKSHFNCFYDESGAIGRRYARQDEIGTPFCVTIDFETLGDSALPNEQKDSSHHEIRNRGAELPGTVTLRERDTAQQTRIKIEDLLSLLLEKIR
ncbi:MAG: glycine--tRNA ligase [Verrucomicrobiota bacterium]|nr:glycine--tRNA ligase [Verrucomicrobiota bacterium]